MPAGLASGSGAEPGSGAKLGLMPQSLPLARAILRAPGILDVNELGQAASQMASVSADPHRNRSVEG